MKPAPEAGSDETASGAASPGRAADRPGRDTPDERRASADSSGVSRNRTDPPSAGACERGGIGVASRKSAGRSFLTPPGTLIILL